MVLDVVDFSQGKDKLPESVLKNIHSGGEGSMAKDYSTFTVDDLVAQLLARGYTLPTPMRGAGLTKEQVIAELQSMDARDAAAAERG
jgi:hypothetical protein